MREGERGGVTACVAELGMNLERKREREKERNEEERGGGGSFPAKIIPT